MINKAKSRQSGKTQKANAAGRSKRKKKQTLANKKVRYARVCRKMGRECPAMAPKVDRYF